MGKPKIGKKTAREKKLERNKFMKTCGEIYRKVERERES